MEGWSKLLLPTVSHGPFWAVGFVLSVRPLTSVDTPLLLILGSPQSSNHSVTHPKGIILHHFPIGHRPSQKVLWKGSCSLLGGKGTLAGQCPSSDCLALCHPSSPKAFAASCPCLHLLQDEPSWYKWSWHPELCSWLLTVLWPVLPRPLMSPVQVFLFGPQSMGFFAIWTCEKIGFSSPPHKTLICRLNDIRCSKPSSHCLSETLLQVQLKNKKNPFGPVNSQLPCSYLAGTTMSLFSDGGPGLGPERGSPEMRVHGLSDSQAFPVCGHSLWSDTTPLQGPYPGEHRVIVPYGAWHPARVLWVWNSICPKSEANWSQCQFPTVTS